MLRALGTAFVLAIAAVGAMDGVAARAGAPSTTLLVTGATGRHAFVVDDVRGVVARIEVGPAPHGVALAAGGRAFVATARGVAIVDVSARRRTALVPYRSPVGPASTGEYRPGGMGITASPDGRFAYVGVYLPGGRSRLEAIDVRQRAVAWSVPVGVRPFDVLVSRDGRLVYSIDHDSYTVTVVDTRTRRTRTIAVAPLGSAAYDKPHYAALDRSGRLLLPYQGRVLLRLDPRTGRRTTLPLTAQTHQHGVTLAGDARLVIVGTGPAGSVAGPASLTVVDVRTGVERVTPLRRAHERVAVRPDGRLAYLTGGYLLETGAWNGVSVVDVETGGLLRELSVPSRPLGVVVLP
jgi:DNA-binding beta-propeller fold protein YncE